MLRICISGDIFSSHKHDNYCKVDIDICRGVQVKAEVEVDVCEAEGSRAEKLRIHRLKHLRKIFSGSENKKSGRRKSETKTSKIPITKLRLGVKKLRIPGLKHLHNLFSVSEN